MSKFKGKVAMVTGSSGFIGKHLCKVLTENGAQVVNFDLQEGDITNALDFNNVFTKQNVDFVFHLAGQKSASSARQNPQATLQLALQGTLNVLEAARKHSQTKVILISSMAVYESSSSPLKENAPLQNKSVYAVSKIAAEYLGFSFAKDLNVPVVIARLANVYGPGQSTEAVVGSAIKQLLTAASLNLGDTSAIRDFVYVEDVVEALLNLAANENTAGQAFNVGSGVATPVSKIVEFICESLKYQGPVRHNANEEKSFVVPDVSAIRQATGWVAKTSLQEGLSKTIEAEREKKK